MIGGAIGSRLLHYPARLFGSGAYGERRKGTYRRPAVKKLQPLPPKFETVSPENGVRIAHREYLGDIITSSTPGAFKIDTFAINPAELNTFPWLSGIATNNFQQYVLESLIFEFRSFSADALNSTNTALGSVFSCINYDYNDPDFTSRQQIENSDWSNCRKPSESFVVPVECKRSVTGNGGIFYIVNGSGIPSGTDAKQYYLGKLSVATQGMQGASVNVGSLYVNYKVRLIKPFMAPPLASALVACLARTGCTTAVPNGTSTTSFASSCDSIGVTWSNTVITIDKKRLQTGMQFFLYVGWSGASAASCACPTLAVSSNATGLSYFNGNVGFTTPGSVITETRVSCAQVIYVYDPNSDITLTWSGGGLPAATCNMSFLFCQINGTPFGSIGTYTP